MEGANDKWLANWEGLPVNIRYDFGSPTQIGS